VQLTFTGDLWYWKGPPPFHFITVPDEESGALEAVAPVVTYGWGMVPVTARIGSTTWTTALFPKEELYIVPVKDVVRRGEGIELGDQVTVTLTVDV
jgi:hypothetical protein